MTVDVRTLADTVWALIAAIPHVNTYRTEILDTDDNPTDPPVDDDGRSHPYAVVYFGAGQNTPGRLGSVPNKTGWGFHVHCVGGDDTRALWAANAVRTALTGTRVAGGVLVEKIPNPVVQRLDGVQPSRTFVALEYGLTANG